MSMCQKVVASILFLLCGTSILFAQGSYTAQIRGTVTDPSGAVVQGATVTITNDATGISVVAHSNQQGLYILTGLRPAMYTLKAEATGFRVIERKNIVLAVSQETTVDLSLSPLSVTETVTVTTAPPLLDTESAAIGTDVTNEYVRDIPLYNRSLFGLVYLAGGVTEATGSGINDNYRRAPTSSLTDNVTPPPKFDSTAARSARRSRARAGTRTFTTRHRSKSFRNSRFRTTASRPSLGTTAAPW